MIRYIITFLILLVSTAIGRTQEATSQHPLAPSDTSSPAATLNSLIDSCNELQKLVAAGAVVEGREAEVLPTTERILDCLDLSQLPAEVRGTAGIQSGLFLKEVLDRIDLPSDSEIPGADSAAENGEPLSRWRIPGTRIAIVRAERGPQDNAYMFSLESVRRAAEYYGMVAGLPYRSEGREVSPGLYDAYLAATKKSTLR